MVISTSLLSDCFLPLTFSLVIYLPSVSMEIIGFMFKSSAIVPETFPILPPLFKYSKVPTTKI